jgi:hypothetical protein
MAKSRAFFEYFSKVSFIRWAVWYHVKGFPGDVRKTSDGVVPKS